MATQTQTPPIPTVPKLDIEATIKRLEQGEALLLDSPQHVMEVVGILDSYGVVLDAYATNLKYIADNQFLVFFPFFKYFNGDLTPKRLAKHLWHDRINYEYAEYCMKGMLWHGDCPFAKAVESEEYNQLALKAIEARIRNRPFLKLLHRFFPEFLLEQARMMTYYSILGQFWTIMSKMFLDLADRYNRGEITAIPQIAVHIREALVADAATPITYSPLVRGKPYDILPESAGYTFLADTGIPYVEAIFFRGTPFMGTMSYNAQNNDVPYVPGEFAYGALYADPLPVGGSGIPPTLLMQDMLVNLPPYLEEFYLKSKRNGLDMRVLICETFQKSMFCVTTACIQGLARNPLTTEDESQKAENHAYLTGWLERLSKSRLAGVNAKAIAEQGL